MSEMRYQKDLSDSKAWSRELSSKWPSYIRLFYRVSQRGFSIRITFEDPVELMLTLGEGLMKTCHFSQLRESYFNFKMFPVCLRKVNWVHFLFKVNFEWTLGRAFQGPRECSVWQYFQGETLGVSLLTANTDKFDAGKCTWCSGSEQSAVWMDLFESASKDLAGRQDQVTQLMVIGCQRSSPWCSQEGWCMSEIGYIVYCKAGQKMLIGCCLSVCPEMDMFLLYFVNCPNYATIVLLLGLLVEGWVDELILRWCVL